MRQSIRYGIAATLIVLSAGGVASSARADEWCGYATGDKTMIQCGYTTLAGCEGAVGKGGMCFIDPDTALDMTHAAPINATKLLPGGSRIFGQESGRG
jgi:hypothetical protein